MATRSGKTSARETTGLRYDDKSHASERPARLDLLKRLERTTRYIGYVSVILMAVIVVSVVAAEMWNRPILIDALILPKAMEDEGYAGIEAADRVADEIHRIEQATKTLARKDKPVQACNEPLPDIEIPGTKLSLASAIGLLQISCLLVLRRDMSVRG